MVRSRSFPEPNSYGISFEGTCRCGEDRHDESPSSFGDPVGKLIDNLTIKLLDTWHLDVHSLKVGHNKGPFWSESEIRRPTPFLALLNEAKLWTLTPAWLKTF